MQSHHFTSHDLDALESYVHDCIQQLPKLPAAPDAAVAGACTQIPTRCSAYHAVCTNMLKEVVSLLSLFSPRLCRLIGQVWDLASLNVFVLLQVANSALQDAQQLREQLAFTECFHSEGQQRQTSLVQRYEDELDRQRVNAQGLRAELQKVRQRANRLAVENGQLHLVVSRVLNAQTAMEATHYDSSSSSHQSTMQEHDGATFCEDIAAVGDTEERELFGVEEGDEDALARIETVHPIESYATDFEQLLQALFQGEERNVALLNEMDRFINSNAVALLWRYGSTEEEHRLMHRMLSASTVGTQTDGAVFEKPSQVSSRGRGQWEAETDDFESDSEECGAAQHHATTQEEHEGEDNQQQQKSAKHEVVAVTKHQVIPATLRAQLDSRPRVQRVLDKVHLNRILLRLYLEKLECDAHILRRRRLQSARTARSGGDSKTSDEGALSFTAVRTPLHRFMKEFFMARYEVPALADFHMMEVVKSCLYYNEQFKIALRRGAVFESTALIGCLPGMPENLVHSMQQQQQPQQLDQSTLSEHHLQDPFQQQQQFVAADIRVALFSRLCELVPFDATITSPPTAGNMPACLLNAVVDVLGDILELDPAVQSLAEVEHVPTEASWGFPRDLALELLTRHLQFVDQVIIEDSKAQITRLAPVPRSAELTVGADCIGVDVFLALFATTWFTYDRRLQDKLRESFNHQLLLSSPFAKKQLAARENLDIETSEQTVHRDSEAPAARLNRMSTRRTSTMVPIVAVGAVAIATIMTPLEMLIQACKTLENETLLSLDLEELEGVFSGLLEAKQADANHRRRQSIRNLQLKDVHEKPGAAISLGGVTEKEFVFLTLQVLHRRRNNYGLRTNSRRLGGLAFNLRPGDQADDTSIPLESLKPGLSSDSLAYVGK